MNGPNDSAAPRGLRAWWTSPPRSGLQLIISPWEYRHLRGFAGLRIGGGAVAAGLGIVTLPSVGTIGRRMGGRWCSWRSRRQTLPGPAGSWASPAPQPPAPELPRPRTGPTRPDPRGAGAVPAAPTRKNVEMSVPGNEGEPITEAGLAAIEAELAELETAGRRDIAARIRVARGHGDLKENGEYHAAKEDQAHMETRILRLRHRLRDAVVVQATKGKRRRLPLAAPRRSATRARARCIPGPSSAPGGRPRERPAFRSIPSRQGAVGPSAWRHGRGFPPPRHPPSHDRAHPVDGR